MALDRIYRLTCDGRKLIDQARTMSEHARRSVLGHCKVRSSNASTAAEARRRAKSEGWARHRESLPINTEHPSTGTSVHPFDLCPNCATALIETEA